MTTLFSIGIINALQATFLACAVWLVTRVWRHPALVQLLWVLVLVKLVTPPMVTVPWQMTSSDTDNGVATVVAAAASEEIVSSRIPSDVEAAHFALSSDFPIEQSQLTPGGTPSVFGDGPFSRRGESPRPLPVAQERATQATGTTDSVIGPLPWQSAAMIVWFFGSAAYLIVSSRRLIRFHRALRGTAPASGELRAWADEIAARIGGASNVRLRMTEARLAPLVWAIGRPTIVLSRPLVAQLSAAEIKTLLAHELAHLRRRDHWVRLLELAVATIFWWHPVVWWARRAIHLAEEHACDAWVVGTFPEIANKYAAALFKAVEFLAEPSQPTPILASRLTRGGDFKERIDHVMNATWDYRLSLPIRLAVVLFAVAVLPLSLRIVNAEEDQPFESVTTADTPTDEPPASANQEAAAPTTAAPSDEADLFGPAEDDIFAPASPSNRQSPREAEIERALKSPVKLDYHDAPLEEVISVLSETVGVDIYLDPRELSQEGVTNDAPVTINLNKEVSLASALNLLLDPLHLSYVVEDEVLKIVGEQRGAKAARTTQNAAINPAAAPTTYTANQRTHIAPGDIVSIAVVGAFADAPIDDEYLVEPSGTVALGPHYGRVKIAGQSFESAEEAITRHLKDIVENPQVQVTLGWQRGGDPFAKSNSANYSQTVLAAGTPPGDLRSYALYAASESGPVGAAELEILREHVELLEVQFKAVDARFQAGSPGGSPEVHERAASKLALAKADLALAEARQDEALAQAHLARKHAEEALKAVQTAYEAGRTTHDVVLQAAQEMTQVKRKLLEVQHAAARRGATSATPADVRAAAAAQLAQALPASQPTDSIGVLKRIVEGKQRELERAERLREKGLVPESEADRAQMEVEISRERLRQAARALEQRQLLVELAEVEFQQAAEANQKAPGSISDLELRKLKLKLELAKAKMRELAE